VVGRWWGRVVGKSGGVVEPGGATAWRGLSGRLPGLLRLEVLLVALPVALVAAAGAGLTGRSAAAVAVRAAAAVLLAAAAAGLALGVRLRRARAWSYAERADDLLVRRGILVRRLSIVPYGRMQFVDVESGVLSRRFGLAEVRLHTAAAASDARIPGLDAAEADRLRDRLTALGEARAAGL